MTAAMDVETFGEEVWDVLEAAGNAPTPEGSGHDGFDILKPSDGLQHHVAVVANFGGILNGCGTAGVRRAFFYRYEKALEAAGYSVLRYEVDQVPFALAVARDEQTAEQGLAQMRKSAGGGTQ